MVRIYMNMISKFYFWLKYKVLGEELKTYEINRPAIELVDAISINKKETRPLRLARRRVKVDFDGNRMLLIAPYNYWFIPTSKGFYYFEVQVQDNGDNKSTVNVYYKMNLLASSIILFFVLCLSVYLIFVAAVFLYCLFVMVSGYEINSSIWDFIFGSVIGVLILAAGVVLIRYLDKGHKRFVDGYLSEIFNK